MTEFKLWLNYNFKLIIYYIIAMLLYKYYCIWYATLLVLLQM